MRGLERPGSFHERGEKRVDGEEDDKRADRDVGPGDGDDADRDGEDSSQDNGDGGTIHEASPILVTIQAGRPAWGAGGCRRPTRAFVVLSCGEPVAAAGSGLDEPLDEGEGGVGDLPPSAVDHQGVAAVGDFYDLGDALVVLLPFEVSVGDGPRYGVVLLSG